MPHAPNAIHCVIVDDHQMLLGLLVGAVSAVPGLAVTATATDVAEADRLASLHRVDLLIVDRQLKTGDGMDVVRRVHARHPEVKCIVIAGVTSDFVCPPDLIDVVVSVIDKTDACEALLAEIARVVELPADATDARLSGREVMSRLTVREWQLFMALGDGLSNKEIANRFGISTRTVETHRKSVARKLGVSGSALVRLAVIQRRATGEPEPQRSQPENISSSGDRDA